MSGFGRNEAVDNAGFRGLIPDNTCVPVVIVSNNKNGAKQVKLKTGDNAGKTATIYRPVFEVIQGPFKGGRIYSDIWCNVEVDSVTGEAKVFGSHLMFCDVCDACGIKEDDGGYPTATSEKDANTITCKMIGKGMLITVGVRKYEKKDGTEASTNMVKNVTPFTAEQEEKVKDKVAPIMERANRQATKAAVKSGASGLEDMMAETNEIEEDDDMPF